MKAGEIMFETTEQMLFNHVIMPRIGVVLSVLFPCIVDCSGNIFN